MTLSERIADRLMAALPTRAVWVVASHAASAGLVLFVLQRIFGWKLLALLVLAGAAAAWFALVRHVCCWWGR